MKFLITALLMFLIGCATGVSGLVRFQDRELLIHPDQPGLAYPHNYQDCVDRKKAWRWLGKKCTTKHKIDFYDLNDASVRAKLIDAGFTAKSVMQFKY